MRRSGFGGAIAMILHRLILFFVVSVLAFGQGSIRYQTSKRSETGAVVRDVESRLREVISILDFGAVGDGVGDEGTDNSEAIQDAIDAAVSSGAEVYAPAGQFNFSTTLEIAYAGVKLRGAGEGKTIFHNTGTGHGLFVYSLNPANTIQNIALSDFTVTGTASSTDGIHMDSIVRGSLTNVSSTGNGGYGLYMERCLLNTIRGGTFEYNTLWGIKAHRRQTGDYAGSNANTFYSPSVQLNTAGGVWFSQSEGNIIRGGDIEANGGTVALYLHGAYSSVIDGVWFEGNTASDVLIEAAESTPFGTLNAIGNRIVNNYFVSDLPIYIDAGNTDGLVLNTMLADNSIAGDVSLGEDSRQTTIQGGRILGDLTDNGQDNAILSQYVHRGGGRTSPYYQYGAQKRLQFTVGSDYAQVESDDEMKVDSGTNTSVNADAYVNLWARNGYIDAYVGATEETKVKQLTVDAGGIKGQRGEIKRTDADSPTYWLIQQGTLQGGYPLLWLRDADSNTIGGFGPDARVKPLNRTASQLSAVASPEAGDILHCTDCLSSNPCAGGGTGALAVYSNAAWRCNLGVDNSVSVQYGLHASRPSPLSKIDGSIYIETDRQVAVQVRDAIGTVDTDGTAVHWVSGPQFSSNWAGAVIIIASTAYTIDSVTDEDDLVLEESAGSQSGAASVVDNGAWFYLFGTYRTATLPTDLGTQDTGFMAWHTTRTVSLRWDGSAWTYRGGVERVTWAGKPTGLDADDIGYLIDVSDRSSQYRWDGDSWIWISGAGASGNLASITTGLGADDAGIPYEATDYGHKYIWTGSSWRFADGDAGSKYIIAGIAAPVGGLWGLCDGSVYAVAQSDGSTANVTSPDLTDDIFIQGGTYTGDRDAATAPSWDANAKTEDASTGITVSDHSTAADTAVTGAGTRVTTATHTVNETAHSHDLDEANAKIKAPNELDGGLPLRIKLQWYIRR